MTIDNRSWSTTISHVWDMNAVEAPDKTAIEDEKTSLTWNEAKRWTDRVALGLLDAGIKRDEVIVIQLPNCVELHLMRVACEKAGILCVPVLSNMREKEMGYTLNYTKAAAAVIPREYRGFDFVSMIAKMRSGLPGLRHVFVAGKEASDGNISLNSMSEQPLEKRYAPDYLNGKRYKSADVSMICLTSGTTGFPKFVKYRAESCGVADDFIDILKLTSADVVAAVAPAARGPNVTTYQAAPRAKARIAMLAWSGAEDALKQIEKTRATVACLVPTQLAMMLEQAEKGRHDLSSVRIWLCAGSLVPPSLVEAVERRIGGVVLSQYGAVDFGVMTLALPEDSFQVRSTTVGTTRFQNVIKLVDDNGQQVGRGAIGEVTGKGAHSALGYYMDSTSTQEVWKEGWYSTGDLGRLDEAGNLMIVGRKKEVIIRGGQNIYPAEIEDLLITHPKVQKVAVVSMPDAIMGERACAYIVPDAAEPLTMDEMASFLKSKGIAAFKIPERLELVEKFPMVADGQKIDKKALTQDIARIISGETGKK